MSRIQTLTTLASTVLLAVALGAGPAYAQSDDLRSADARDAGTPAAVGTEVPASLGSDLRTADARDAGTPAAVTAEAPASPGSDLRTADAREGAATATPVVVQVASDPDTGMSWDSAAIGALIAAGLLVSLAGMAVLVSRRRAPRHARAAM